MKKLFTLTCSIGVIAIFFAQLSFSQGTWTQKANFGGTARFGVTSFAIGTKGYMGTGWDGTTLFQDFWEYDPQTDTWTQKATFPGIARFVAVGFSFSVGTKGYIGTGWNGSGQTDQSDFWEYDQTTNGWTQKASFLGGQRNGAVSFSIGNKGYIGTGWNITDYPVYFHQDFWEYNPQTDIWAQKSNFPGSGRQGGVGFSIGSKGYIGLGGGGSGSTLSTYFQDFWEYDQQTDTWVQKANFPAAGRHFAVGFSIGTQGYIGTGGIYPSGPYYSDFWAWDQATNAWTQKANFGGTARMFASGFSIGTKGYLGTGWDGASQNDFWEFSPASPNLPGSSCATAIDLGRGDTTVNNITMTDSVMWFKFMADSSSIAVTAVKNTGSISKMMICSGSCSSLNVFTAISSGGNDTLLITKKGYVKNNIYYLKLIGSNFSLSKLVIKNLGLSCGDYFAIKYNSSVHDISCSNPSPSVTITYDISQNCACPLCVCAMGILNNFYLTDAGNNIIQTITSDAEYFQYCSTSPSAACAAAPPNGCGSTSSWCGDHASKTFSLSNLCSLSPGVYYLAIKTEATLFGCTSMQFINAEAQDYAGSPISSGFSGPFTTTSGTLYQVVRITVPAHVSVTATPVPSNGCSNGSATAVPSDGCTPYTYSWNTIPAQTTQTANNLSAGNYQVTVRDAQGCSATAATTVGGNTAIAITLSKTNAACSAVCNGSAAAGVTGGQSPYAYSWNPGGATTSAISNLCGGAYTVTVTDAAACTKTAGITVPTNPLPTITVAPASVTICIGRAATLTAGGASTYSWSPATALSSTTGAVVIANPTATITYTVTGTNASGCSNTALAKVTISSTPTVTITGPTILCQGQGATLNAGTGYNSYLWSTGASSQTIPVTASGTYTVTVANANGCTAIATLNLTVYPLPIANAGNDKTTCSGTPVSIGSLPVATNTYAWTSVPAGFNSNVANPTVTPTIGITTYNLLVTDAHGCQSTDGMTVTVIPSPPNAEFGYYDEYCMGSQFMFMASTTLNTNSREWNFGDGTPPVTTTVATVYHTYSKPGEYVVTQKACNANQCCTSTSYTVHVTPTTADYNDNCCSLNYPYTYNGNKTIASAADAVNFFGNTNLVSIRGILRITNNQAVTFSTKKVLFGPWGKLIIEPGSSLTLDNSTLDGIMCSKIVTKYCSDCNPPRNITQATLPVMWQGVEVWGDEAKTQAQIYQGKIVIQNNSSILDAHNAVVLGQPNGASYISAKSGGILIATTNSLFKNNGYGIKVFPYKFPEISRVQNCSFQSDALLDPGYDLNNTLGYRYPDVYNLSYGYANSLKRTYTDIYSDGTQRLRIMDNTLNNAEYGVISGNCANWYIPGTGSGNKFYNMKSAITFVNWYSTIFGNRIEYNRFEYITNVYGWVTIGGSQYDGIRDNSFNPTLSVTTQNNMVALLMDNCSGFNVNDNTFRLMSLGVWAFSSGTAGGTIGFDAKGNTFDRCKTGVRVHGTNPALQIKCNNHLNNNQLASPYFLDWYLPASTPAVTLANQGNFANTSTHDPAGNEFNQTLPNQFKDIWSTTPFNYLHHDPSNSPSVKPGLNGPATGQVLTTANLFQSTYTKNSTSCFPAPDPCGCNPSCCRLASISNLTTQINSLGIVYNNTLANLDQGQTTQLIAAINGQASAQLRTASSSTNNTTVSAGNLKDMLLAASPLSDEVLLAFINRSAQTPPGIFKDVIIPNSPVSDDVRTALYAKLNSMPPGIVNQIKAAQLSAQYSTLTLISRQLESATIKRQMLINDAVTYYADTNDVDSAIVMLRIENSVQADQTIAATLIAAGRFAEAQTQLSAMTASSAEEQAFIDLQSMLLNLEQSGKTVFEMDSVQEQLVRQVATMPVSCLARTNARAILFIVFNEQFSDEFQLNSSLRMMQMNSESNEYQFTPEHKYLGENYPNPFNNTTIIPYILPEGSNGMIRIYDVNGKQIGSYNLMEGINQLQISTNTWNSGVYTYSMDIDGMEMEHRKMVLIKE